MKKPNVAIVIVVYNVSDLIVKQIECINTFCVDNYDIIIIDNSDDKDNTDAILYRLRDIKHTYIKTFAHTGDPSMSHAFAANFAYLKYNASYDYMLFLDHDCFPITGFSVIDILCTKIMGGLGQTKPSGKTYLWPGCFVIDNKKVDTKKVDFSPNRQFGLDTGGNLYAIIDKAGLESIQFFDEAFHENIMFTAHYNFYSIINNMFMHFINGSNWNPLNNKDKHQERLSSLLAILQGYIEKNSTVEEVKDEEVKDEDKENDDIL